MDVRGVAPLLPVIGSVLCFEQRLERKRLREQKQTYCEVCSVANCRWMTSPAIALNPSLIFVFNVINVD